MAKLIRGSPILYRPLTRRAGHASCLVRLPPGGPVGAGASSRQTFVGRALGGWVGKVNIYVDFSPPPFSPSRFQTQLERGTGP